MSFRFFLTKIINYLVVCVLIAASIPLMASAEYDEEFFAGNDILFYNPNDTGCITDGSGIVNLVGNDNIEKTLRYFIGRGLTLAQASGIAGNLQAKSAGINPARIQGSGSQLADENYTLVAGKGFGIAQWTSGGRQQGLVALSKSSNRSIIDLSLQLDYLWQELNGDYNSTLSSLKKTTTPEDAAIIFHNGYEKSADSEDTIRTVRGGIARGFYDSYSSKIPDNITNGSNNPESIECTDDSSGGNGEASSYIDGFAIYNQRDPQWSNKIYGGTTTIGEAGCGPSAMAMIITALTGIKITPIDTARYGASNGTFVEGEGSSHNIASILSNHWGLKSTSITASITKVSSVLRSGGLVLAVATGSPPYTNYGHFIVIRAVTENGKWMIGDSNGNTGKTNSSKEWDPSIILNGGLNGVKMWAIKK